MIPNFDSTVLWIVIVAFVIAFILAFGVGANDVANSFGTSVGSGVLTFREACILATIFEILGSALLGYKVASTIQTGVFDINVYRDQEKILMLGYLSALFGGALWNLLATFAKLPVSGTHSIIGAVFGFTVVLKGFTPLNWKTLTTIALSWIISPILSGIISIFICIFIMKFIVNKPEPLEPGLKALPLFYGITLFINLISILHDGPSYFKLDQLEWWISISISAGISFVVAIFVWFYVVPRQRRKIAPSIALQSSPQSDLSYAKAYIHTENGRIDEIILKPVSVTSHADLESNASSAVAHNGLDDGIKKLYKKSDNVNGDVNDFDGDRPEVAALFKYLQILTACFGSFAHGANDVSNAIGPLIAIVIIWNTGDVYQKAPAPYWLMLYGGVGISVGLIVWGKKVVETIGTDLTKITPSTGFCIEIGSAATVLLASKIGLPISTTHCKVGSVVMVGKYGKKEKATVDWALFRNIIMAWILTVPVTALLSGGCMWFLDLILPDSVKTSDRF